MRRLAGLGLSLALALGCGAWPARADEVEKPPCLKETQTLCPLVPVGLVQACLQAHVSELSETCRKRVPEMNDDIGRLDRACGSDVARFCTEPQTAAGQRVDCLFKHREQLSHRCQDVFDDLLKQK
jgi:hypothetical protein